MDAGRAGNAVSAAISSMCSLLMTELGGKLINGILNLVAKLRNYKGECSYCHKAIKYTDKYYEMAYGFKKVHEKCFNDFKNYEWYGDKK